MGIEISDKAYGYFLKNKVAKAKGNLREIKLYAQVGFTETDNEFNSAYRRLKDNQIVEVGFKIPILDWGKRRGQVKICLLYTSP